MVTCVIIEQRKYFYKFLEIINCDFLTLDIMNYHGNIRISIFLDTVLKWLRLDYMTGFSAL